MLDGLKYRIIFLKCGDTGNLFEGKVVNVNKG